MIKTWAVYSTETGMIRLCLTGVEQSAQANTQPGEAYIEGLGRAGIDKVIDGAIVEQPTPVEVIAAGILQERGRLLMISDWTQLPDVPLATKEAWQTYRQALRDITDQPGYPLDITWPTQPGAQS